MGATVLPGQVSEIARLPGHSAHWIRAWLASRVAVAAF